MVPGEVDAGAQVVDGASRFGMQTYDNSPKSVRPNRRLPEIRPERISYHAYAKGRIEAHGA